MQPAVELPHASAVQVALMGAAAGVLCAVAFIHYAVPELTQSSGWTSQKMPWYLARTSGFAAYGLLWLSVVLGLLVSGKGAWPWTGGALLFGMHQFSSMLALGFSAFHALVLLGDSYIGYGVADLLVPFAGGEYRPSWVGLGQVATYLGGLVALSWYVRRRIGRKAWRTLHFASFAVYLLVLAHGIGAGTDTAKPAVGAMYVLTGTLTFFLVNYRVLVLAANTAKARRGFRNAGRVTNNPAG